MTTLINLNPFPALLRCVALASVLLMPLSYGQSENSLEEQDRYEILQQRAEELEATAGPYGPALVEQLVTLADFANELNLYVEAASFLDRAIQIHRLNSGLFSAGQIPLFFKLVETQISAGNWAQANEALDYLYWLMLEKQAGIEGSIIDNLVRLGEFQLLGVAADAEQEQTQHYRKAEAVTYLSLRLSEQVWGATDLRRISLYYSLLKQFYLQSAAIERGGDTGYELRLASPNSTSVIPERLVHSRYYRAGLRLFSELRETFASDSDIPAEVPAMIDLYRADWELLFDNDQAEDWYQAAYAGLLDAGVARDTLDRYFSQPRILPVPVLYASVDQALTATSSGCPSKPDNAPQATDNCFQFQEWFDAMPFIPFPLTSPALDQTLTAAYTDSMLHFRLNGLNKVSRWVKGTYQTHLSVAEEFQLLDDSASEATYRLFSQRLHFLHFRPTLREGQAQQFEGILQYRAALD